MERIGQVNTYENATHKPIEIINLANGTTPFIHVFEGVEYMSSFYRVRGKTVTVTQGHYRPKKDEFDLMKPDEQEHILNAGLWVGPLYSACWHQLVDDPVQPGWDFEKFQEWALGYYGKRLPAEDVA